MDKRGWKQKRLIFITGKGGVGKTTIANETAQELASEGLKTLFVDMLKVVDGEQALEKAGPNLWKISLNANACFEEYIQLKLKLKPLYSAFLNNKITQYLEKAAPGIKELVLIGKVWFERNNYDRIVVDMPSSGYALTMVHTPFNFANLFPGGPVFNDCHEMIKTFSDPGQSAFVVVTLPEEMPLQESLELAADLHGLMPENKSWLVVNRKLSLDARTRELAKDVGAIADLPSHFANGVRYLATREKKQTELLENFDNAETREHFHADWYVVVNNA